MRVKSYTSLFFFTAFAILTVALLFNGAYTDAVTTSLLAFINFFGSEKAVEFDFEKGDLT